MDFSSIGKLLLVMGLSVAAVGLCIMLFGKWSGAGSGLGWLGRLPGDIFIKRENFTFYFPLATSILISVIGSFLLYFFVKR